MNGPAPSWARCSCGAKVTDLDPQYGAGYCGTFQDACQPCWEAAEERADRAQWADFAYGPGPAVFDGDW